MRIRAGYYRAVCALRTGFGAAACAVALSAASPAFAACTSPAGNAGDISYSATQNIMAYCNGASWVGMGSTATFGALTSGDLCEAVSTTQISCNFATISLATQVSGILPPANGGTGVANANTITLGGNIVTTGAFQTSGGNSLTLTTTGATNVTLPTSGTLITSSVASLPNLAQVGTITSGVWNATPITVPYGGTGATSLTGYVYGNGTGAMTASTTIPGTAISGNITGNAANVTGTVPVANGGTGQTTAQAARGSAGLDIDEMTTVGDSNYAIQTADRTLATFAPLTAARTWTLPAAASINAGQSVCVVDKGGEVTATNTLTIAPGGTDTINGGATGYALNAAYQGVCLISDGASAWSSSLIPPSQLSGAYVKLQSTTPGTQQTGNMNISGNGVFGGSVGIGTTAPGNALDVNGSADIGYPGTAAPASGLIVEGSTAIGTAVPISSATLTASSSNTAGYAMYAKNSGSTGSTYGVYASAVSGSGIGVYGNGGLWGVYGNSAGNTGVGGVGTNTGVYGQGPAYGVHGVSVGTTGVTWGVYGSSVSSSGYGVYGTNTSSGVGGYFTSTSGYALITGTGNVGIGTTNPTQALTVNGNLLLTGAAGREIIQDSGYNLQVGWSGGGGLTLASGGGSGADLSLVTGGSNNFVFKNLLTELARITSTGNVGIGTTTPAELLTVAKADTGTYAPSSTSAYAPWTSGTSAVIQSYNPSATDSSAAYNAFKVANAAGNAQRAYISAVSTPGATAYTPALTFGAQTGSGAYNEYMRIGTTGFVGIGTTSPAQALDVYGNISVNAITNGYYLAGNEILFQPASDTTSIAVGPNALATQSGNNLHNTAVGFAALRKLTTGTGGVAASNAAFGYSALHANSTGSGNIAVGESALGANTSGGDNAAIGNQALYASTTGNRNVAVGADALEYGTVIYDNTALGWFAGGHITGSNNSVLGYSVGSVTLTSGSSNILIGTSSAVDVPSTGLAGATSNFLNIGNTIFATGMTGTVAAPAGNVGIGTATPANTLDIGNGGGIHITDGTPTSIANALYSVGSALYWNGNPIGGSGVTSFSAGTTGLTPSIATTGAVTLAGTLNVANGGTGQTTAQAARGSAGLDIDEMTTVGDSDYAIQTADRTLATFAPLTAARTWTLPAAASINAGQSVCVVDKGGEVTATNTLTIAPGGTDTINGGATGYALNAAYQGVCLISDGASTWSSSLIPASQLSGAYVKLQSTTPGTQQTGNMNISGNGVFGGNVGIGTVSPQNKLDIAGGIAIGTSFAGVFSAPTNGAIIQGKVGIGTPVNGDSQLNVLSNLNSVPTGGYASINSYLSVTPSADMNATDSVNGMADAIEVENSAYAISTANGVYGQVTNGNSSTNNANASINGLNGFVWNTGNAGLITGVNGLAENDGTAGTVSGGNFTAEFDNGAGYSVEGAGLNPIVGTGTISNGVYGADIMPGIYGGAVTGGLYGVYVNSYIDPSATVDYRYGVYIEDPNFSSSATLPTGQDYGIYQAGAGQNNYFAGNVGIGTTLPQSLLDIAGANNGSSMDDALILRNLAWNADQGVNMQFWAGTAGGSHLQTAMISSKLIDAADGNLYFDTTYNSVGGTRMMILNNGNVGIGTTSPAAKLDVYGGIDLNGVNGISQPAGDASSIAVGPGALANQTGTGLWNTAVGDGALYSNNTGFYNTASGFRALSSNTTGTWNTASGLDALMANSSGSGNTAIGGAAMNGDWGGNPLTGGANTAVGDEALFNIQGAASNNTVLGQAAGHVVTTGSNNTILGFGVAFTTLTTGTSNILIGTSNAVDVPTTGSAGATSNFLNIGNTIFATGVNTGTLAAPAGNVGIGTTGPLSTLDVNGGVAIGTSYAGAVAAPTSGAIIQGQVAIGTSTPQSGPYALTVNGGSYGLYVNAAYSDFIGGGGDVQIYSGASGPYIGNYSNGSFALITNGSDRLHITNTGLVGIGTTTPANTLDIGNGGGIHITDGTPTSTANALYSVSGALYWNGSAVGSGGGGSSQWTTLGSNIYYNTGNVGIGTTAPGSVLEIDSATYNSTTPVFQVNNTAASQGTNWFPLFGGLATNASSGAKVQMIYGVANSSANRVEETFTYAGSGSNNNMLSLGFFGNNYPFNILYNGNVGIGTTNPSSPLTVASGTSEMDVTPGWRGGTGTWINLDTNGPSGIGSGGAGANAWIGYVSNPSNWSEDSLIGDIVYRNSSGRLLFNTNGGAANSTMAINGSNVGIGTTTPAAKLDVYGGIDLNGMNGISQPAGDNTSIAVGAVASVYQSGTNQNNTAVGFAALYGGGGYNNTAVGSGALSGFGENGINNSAFGVAALGAGVTGNNNTAMGENSLGRVSSGNYNVALGWMAGGGVGYGGITTGNNNIAIGPQVASTTLDIGSNNILIGTSNAVDVPTTGSAGATSNFLNIGNTIFATGVNTGTLAAPAGYVGIGTAAPAGTLDVEGGTNASGAGSNVNIVAQSAGSGDNDGGNIILAPGSSSGGGNKGSVQITNWASLGLSPGSAVCFGPSCIYGGNAPNYLRLSADGGNDLYINSSGSVGIGTITPANTLDIGNGGGIHITDGTPTSTANALYSVSGALYWNGSAVGSGGSGSSQWTTLGSNIYYNTGNVGIGTTTPTEPLTVAKADTATYAPSSTSAYAPWTSGASAVVQAYNTSATDNSAAYDALKVTNAAGDAQRAYIGAVSTTGSGVYTPALTFGAQSGSGAYNEYMRIGSTGNVGIGTASPNYLLDVETSTADYAIYGKASGIGVFGATTGAGVGVYGYANSSGATAITGNNPMGAAVNGLSTTDWGPAATFMNNGGGSNIGSGVQGTTNNTGTGSGVSGSITGAGNRGSGIVGSNTGAGNTGAGGYFTNTGGGYALITGTGNVGIDTTTPTELLTVAKADTATYAPSSTSAYAPWTSGASAVVQSYNPSATDSSAAYNAFKVANAAGNAQRAYISAVSTPGATAYTPALTFGAQTGSGAYNEYMRIGTTGFVGIGTTSPGTKLDLNGALTMRGMAAPAVSASGQGIIYFDSTANTFQISQNGSVYTALGSGGGQWTTSGSNIYNNNTGYVGIKTTAPVTALDTNGTIRTTGMTTPTSGAGLEMYWSGTAATLLSYDRTNSVYKDMYWSGSNAYFQTTKFGASVGDLVVNSSGNVTAAGNMGVGTLSPNARLEVDSPNTAGTVSAIRLLNPNVTGGSGEAIDFYAGATNKNARIYNYATNVNQGDLRFATSNGTNFTDALTILGSNQNVGIGTTAPNETLDVWGASDVNSSSATAFTVGPNGATNPTLTVNSSTASGVTGISITNAATGGTTVIQATDSGANSNLKITNQGTGGSIVINSGQVLYLNINGTTQANFGSTSVGFAPGAVVASSTVHFRVTVPADINLPVGANVNIASFNGSGVTRQHATGALALQSDYNFGGATDSFVGASTLTLGDTLSVSYKDCGTSGTCSGEAAIYVPTYAFTGTVTNGYGLYVQAPTAASSGNYAAVFTGGNVGIGTTSPGAMLEVQTTTSGANSRVNIFKSTGTTSDKASLQIGYNASNNLEIYRTQGNADIYYTSNQSGANQQFTTTGAGNFIFNNGNVGIGTTSPADTLDVTGTGIHIGNGTPGTTTYALYNSAGTLMWNGLSLATSGSGGSISGTANYIPVFTGTGTSIGNSVMYQSGSNVGIGTTAPSDNLDVRGVWTYSSSTNLASQFKIRDVSATNMQLELGVDTTNKYSVIQSAEPGTAYRNLILQPSSGNVGIGTTAPLALLHLSNSASPVSSGQETLRIAGNSNGTILGSGPYIRFDSTANSEIGRLASVAEGVGLAGMAFSTFNGSDSERLRISSSGNVGIGTTNPTYKLDIAANTGGVQLARITNTDAGTASLAGFGAYNDTTTGYGWFGTAGTGYTTVPILQDHAFMDAGPNTSGIVINAEGGVNPIILSTNSTERMRILAGGNVGIGTTAPAEKLHILNSTNYQGLRLDRTAASVYTDLSYYTAATRNWLIRNDGATSNLYIAEDNGTGSANYRMTFQAGGNVGIGTTSPAYLLDVSSTSGVTGIQVENQTAGTGNAATVRVVSDDHALNLSSMSSAWPTAGWNWQSGSSVGASGAGGLSVGASASTGVLRFYTGGSATANERMRIDSAGNVGIGTTVPATALDVTFDSNSPSPDRSILNELHGNSVHAPLFLGRKSRGTGASPAAVASGDNLSAWEAEGFDGTSYIQGGVAGFVANGTIATGSVPTDFVVQTGTNSGGQERLRITSAGYVGIWTTSPQSTLDVGAGSLWIRDTGILSNVQSGLKIGASSGINYIESAGAAMGAGTAADVRFTNMNAGTTWMTLQGSTGNVGIGTTSPTSQFQNYDAEALSASYTSSLFSALSTSSTASVNKIGMDIESTGTWNGTNAVNTGLVVNATGGTTNYAGIFNGGNVGIGTASPNSLLQVYNGEIQVGSSGNSCSSSTNGGAIRYSSGVLYYCNNANTWQSLASSAGAGTVNYVARWTPNGVTLGTGALYDNGTKVGIGTTGQNTQLTVLDSQSGFTTFTGTTNQGIQIQNPNLNAFATLGFTGWSSAFAGVNLAQIGAKFTVNGSYLEFGTSNSFASGITNTAMIIDFNGAVGLGTTLPGGKIHAVGGSSQYAGVFQSDQSVTTWTTAYASFNIANSNATTNNVSIFSFSDAVGGASSAGVGATYTNRTSHYGDLWFYTKGTDGYIQRLYITSTGSVGIGTASPQAGLDVDNGHFLVRGGSSPTISSCGTGASASGSDSSFKLTVGSTATTSCVVNFGSTWSTAPLVCVLQPMNATAAATGTTGAYVSAISTTQLTITGSALANAAYGVHCF